MPCLAVLSYTKMIEKLTSRQTDRQTDRQRDRETERRTHTQKIVAHTALCNNVARLKNYINIIFLKTSK